MPLKLGAPVKTNIKISSNRNDIFMDHNVFTTWAASTSPDGVQWNNSPPVINSSNNTTVVPVSITLYKETILGCLNRAKRPASLAE